VRLFTTSFSFFFLGSLVVVLGPKGLKKMKEENIMEKKEKILVFGNCVKNLDTGFIVEGYPPLGYGLGKILQI
jgi:hypothetical protein